MSRSNATIKSCPHATEIHPKLSLNLIETYKYKSGIPDQASCYFCGKLRSLADIWLCLHCANIFCSTEGSSEDLDHSLFHCTENNSHALALRLSDVKTIWCYMCEKNIGCSERNTQDSKIYLPQTPAIEVLIPSTAEFLDDIMANDECNGISGLRNLGNTCYMNSALQALNSCQLLTAYFLYNEAQINLCKNPKLSLAYKKFILDNWSDTHSPVLTPNYIFSAITSINSSFKGYLQQDAQEFLVCLMDKLHEELKHLECYGNHLTPSESDKPSVQYTSYISDVFNGQILSTVTCQSCNKVSKTRETFQDLSLSIPSPEQVRSLESQWQVPTHSAPTTNSSGSWLPWLQSYWSYILPWNWFGGGEAVTLENCLTNFFTEASLTGDNMYSCENCRMLRNGVKRVQIVKLPEVLRIHLKRFRHDYMHSSKISYEVEFQKGLDLDNLTRPGSNDAYESEGISSNTTYTLTSVICHQGNVGGGHYTAFARHPVSGIWYECNDSHCTQVSLDTVLASQAYILFYQRNPTKEMEKVRDRYKETAICNQLDSSGQTMGYYVSRLWLLRFLFGANPGPITAEYLCVHGKFRPREWECCEQMVVKLSAEAWMILDESFGHHGEPIQSLEVCLLCQHNYFDMKRRCKTELQDRYIRENDRKSRSRYCISYSWFGSWVDFHQELREVPPGPIDNYQIAVASKIYPGRNEPKQSSKFHIINGTLWRYLCRIYGGGPEVVKFRDENCESDSEGETPHLDGSENGEASDPDSSDADSVEVEDADAERIDGGSQTQGRSNRHGDDEATDNNTTATGKLQEMVSGPLISSDAQTLVPATSVDQSTTAEEIRQQVLPGSILGEMTDKDQEIATTGVSKGSDQDELEPGSPGYVALDMPNP